MARTAVDEHAGGRDPDSVNIDPITEWLRQRDPVRAALLAMVVVWSVVFIALGTLRHERYGTFSFDLGIYDQGIWLLSRLRVPFVTIKGLHLFGHHTNLILFLLVPFYWL